jgi:hypothetical protein
MTAMGVSPPYLILRKIFKTYDLGSDLDRKVLILLGAALQILPTWYLAAGCAGKWFGFGLAPCVYYMSGVKGFSDD